MPINVTPPIKVKWKDALNKSREGYKNVIALKSKEALKIKLAKCRDPIVAF
jgi:hypothetical protein